MASSASAAMARTAAMTSTKASTSTSASASASLSARVALTGALAFALAVRLAQQKAEHARELDAMKDALEVERTARVVYEARVRSLERWPWFAWRRTGDLMSSSGAREKASAAPEPTGRGMF